MKLVKILPFALLCMAGSAWADPGWYLVGEVTHSRTKVNTSTFDSALTTAGATGLTSNGKSNHTRWRLQLGYQFNPNFAVEAGYIDFGKANYSASYAGGSASGTLKAGGVDIAALGILPLTDQLSVFGKAGIVAVRAKSSLTALSPADAASGSRSADSIAPLFGLGATYQFSKTLALRAEYDHASNLGKSGKTGKMSANMVSLGMEYRF